MTDPMTGAPITACDCWLCRYSKFPSQASECPHPKLPHTGAKDKKRAYLEQGIIQVSDLSDPDDPEHRSYKDVNREKVHNIPIGTLVEIESGVRLWVVHHGRDCDQTPLYSLCIDREDTVQERPGMSNRKWDMGYPEHSLKVVND